MPTVRVFGKEVEQKTLWIGGGLAAAAVAVIVWLRSRAATAPSTETQAQQPDQGYGMTVGAPSGQVADQYQQKIQNSELEAQAIANKYQSNLVTQQQTQFDFQQKMSELLAPDILSEQQSELAAETHYQKTVAGTKISCPPGQALGQDPDGNLSCRQKGSGAWGPLPVGGASRAAKGFVRGVEVEAPEAGRQLTRAAEKYAEARYLSPKKSQPKQPVGAHGYDMEHI